jgi:molybdopterin molybdotransferase
MELTLARESAMALVTPNGVEWVGLEIGLGRVLGETIYADCDVPLEYRSRLDGFVLRSSDTAGAFPEEPVILRIMPGLLAAGHMPVLKIGAGESVRILTGAPVPPGADSVVAQESSFRDGDQLVLKHPLAPGSGVTRPGEETRAGDLVVAEGEILTPTRLALIAALGRDRLAVYRKPTVALMATGDEVREPGGPLQGSGTFCNNRLLLGWLVRLQGAEPIHMGVARDDAHEIAGRLEHVESDVVITTGGIGRGDKDFILEVWESLGVRVVFRHVDLSPGTNTALGIRGKQVFWACPGSPWAGQIIFEELVAPALRRSLGLKGCVIPAIPARLESAIVKKTGLCRAARGVLDVHAIPPLFTPTSGKDTTHFAMIKNNIAYTIVESRVSEVPKGSIVKVRPGDLPLLASHLFERTESAGKASLST